MESFSSYRSIGSAQVTFATGINPSGVAVDSTGKVLFSDYDLDHLLVYTPGSLSPPTSLGSGFLHPNDVSINMQGDIYVTDTGYNRS